MTSSQPWPLNRPWPATPSLQLCWPQPSTRPPLQPSHRMSRQFYSHDLSFFLSGVAYSLLSSLCWAWQHPLFGVWLSAVIIPLSPCIRSTSCGTFPLVHGSPNHPSFLKNRTPPVNHWQCPLVVCDNQLRNITIEIALERTRHRDSFRLHHLWAQLDSTAPFLSIMALLFSVASTLYRYSFAVNFLFSLLTLVNNS